MAVIKEQTWSKASDTKWQDLTDHRWSDYRLAAMEYGTDMQAQGVEVITGGATVEYGHDMQAQGVRVDATSSVMTYGFEMDITSISSERDYHTKMIKYLPMYERKSDMFNTILEVDANEFSRVEQQLDKADNNLFWDTAVEWLGKYESELGIKPDNKLDYVRRREQITARWRAIFDQTTEQTMKNVAKAFTNGKIEINETKQDGVFEIKFTGIGVPYNFNQFKEIIDVIVPAHLEFQFKFSYATWGDANSLRWSDETKETWSDIRNDDSIVRSDMA